MTDRPPELISGGTALESSTIRVLIVDDHELLRDGLKELLGNQPDLQVCGEAASEAEAMERARAIQPDLVTVDVALKQGNGINLIRRLKAEQPDVQVVVVSMYDETLYAERAIRVGARAYVCKQRRPSVIIDAIRAVMAGDIYLSEEMTQRMVRQVAGSRGEQGPLIEGLSSRELEVFTLIGEGLLTRQIAEKLHISPRTVDSYRERLKAKLNLENAAQLNRAAMHWVLEHG